METGQKVYVSEDRFLEKIERIDYVFTTSTVFDLFLTKKRLRMVVNPSVTNIRKLMGVKWMKKHCDSKKQTTFVSWKNVKDVDKFGGSEE